MTVTGVDVVMNRVVTVGCVDVYFRVVETTPIVADGGCMIYYNIFKKKCRKVVKMLEEIVRNNHLGNNAQISNFYKLAFSDLRKDA